MLPAPTYTLPDDNYAVVLNANAGRVTNRLARSVEQVVPQDRLFYTESPEHADEVFQQCIQREIGTVFAGGGDGTIIGAINALNTMRGEQRMPNVGVLRLGTGNALAHWLGSGSPVHDLRRWNNGQVHRSVAMSLIESEGTLFPFAGLGVDAAFQRVAKEIAPAAPELAVELQQVNHEVSGGIPRIQALRRLDRRTGLAEVNSLVNVLTQADRFGTSIAHALRIHSDMVRTKRMLAAEEQAAQIAPKLTVAMILFILPSLFIVLIGPAGINVFRNLIPAMSGQ